LQHEPIDAQIDFRTGIPNFSLFPKDKWGKLYRDLCVDLPVNELDYYEPSGSYALRRQLAKHLKRARGVDCHPDQILITSGAAQAFNLLIQHFSKLNYKAIVEDPISYGITKIIDYYKMPLCPVPVDEEGLKTDLLDSLYGHIRCRILKLHNGFKD